MDELEGSLYYPPRGSVGATDYAEEVAESLSAEPEIDEKERTKQQMEPERR